MSKENLLERNLIKNLVRSRFRLIIPSGLVFSSVGLDKVLHGTPDKIMIGAGAFGLLWLVLEAKPGLIG